MTKYTKKSYTITAEIASVGTKVYNHLEDSHYVTSEKKPVILTGTRGEKWTISTEQLLDKYLPVDGSYPSLEVGQSFLITPVLGEVNDIFAVPTNGERVTVETSWGEVLKANRPGIEHGDGDYIAYSVSPNGEPNENDRWIINGAVFVDTYHEC